jgi:cell division protein FtsQ
VEQPAVRGAGDRASDPSRDVAVFRRRWAIRVLVLGSVVAGAVAAWAFGRPGGWLVEHVVFEGPHEANEASLRHLADVRNGDTWWGVDLAEVERNVERHPWVRSAHAARVWPDTIVVEVTEHRPAALLHDGGRLVLVDDGGIPFLPVRAGTVPMDLPHVTGIDRSLGELHPDLPVLALRNALWLVGALDEHRLVARGRVDEVSFSRATGWVVEAGPAELSFGLSDLPRQLDRLSRLVAGGLSLDTPTSVDLAPATVAIVRPRAHAVFSDGS